MFMAAMIIVGIGVYFRTIKQQVKCDTVLTLQQQVKYDTVLTLQQQVKVNVIQY